MQTHSRTARPDAPSPVPLPLSRITNRRPWMAIQILMLIVGSAARLSAATAYPMFVAPPGQTVLTGDIFQLTLRLPETPTLIVGLLTPDAHAATFLQAFSLDVAFDPAILQLQSVTEGAFLSSDGVSTFFFGGLVDNSSGLATFISDARTGPDGILPANGGDLVMLTFQAIHSTSSTTINIQNACLLNSYEVNTGTSACEFSELASGYSASADIAVSESSVPEPSTSMLCGLALCGLSLTLSKKSRNGGMR